MKMKIVPVLSLLVAVLVLSVQNAAAAGVNFLALQSITALALVGGVTLATGWADGGGASRAWRLPSGQKK